jgi:hypothetical protein
MAIYLEKYNGYIVDNPNIDFERCDGEIFSYSEVSTASMNSTANNLPIQGGQGVYPLAYIDTDKSLEMTFASAQFTLDMFAMANGTKIIDADTSTLETKRYDVDAGLTATIPFEVQDKSVKIRGLEEDDTADEGFFKVTITPATAVVPGETVILFDSADVTAGDTLSIAYRRRITGASNMDVKTNSTTAKGALYAHWPVYSSGTDCRDAAVKGWLHLFIPRVRVTALPGFDNSYKSAATNSITFAALDAKRGDNKAYRLTYEPMSADGEYIATGTGTVEWL